MTGRGEPLPLLAIGGSDSGGAAGIQADLKTWCALGVYGMSALTVVTAQNSVEVAEALFLPAPFVARQVQVVLADYGAAAIKTGFLGEAAIVEAVAGEIASARAGGGTGMPTVVDPVLVNHRGEAMFPAAVTAAYRRHLLPLSDLITPNRREVALLLADEDSDRLSVESVDDMATAARRLHAGGARSVLVKGGREGSDVIDVFFDGRAITLLRQSSIDSANTHGSGDTLSAAISAFLARGDRMLEAVQKARRITREALAGSAEWAIGQGHGPLDHARIARDYLAPAP